ncbi:MAG: ribonuclease III [Gammaproteobacteria bacterium]|nr:ribonuclease III [Gammaproteobacteria bacterium]
MREPVERLAKAISYGFRDWQLLDTALTHCSVGSRNNERQEFLGDAILGFVIANELFVRFPDAKEGDLSRLRASLVKGDSLAIIARELEVGQYLALGQGELSSGGQSRNSILADAMEAVFAAVYLDGGYSAARAVILNQFESRLKSLNPDTQQKDPKTQLQEFLQAHKLSLPTYTISSITGEQHDLKFLMICQVESLKKKTEGGGSSRRKAEQQAAENMLKVLTND